MFSDLIRKSGYVLGGLSIAILLYLLLYKVIYSPVNLEGLFEGTRPSDDCLVADVDNDGIDEICLVDFSEHPRRVELVSHQLEYIDVVNYFEGESISGISWIDLDQDSTLELGIPYRDRDSVIFDFYNCSRAGLDQFESHSFAQGEDTREIGKWDGYYKFLTMIDVDSDSVNEAIIHVHTNYNYQPRALIAYDVQECKELWRYRFGTVISEIQFGDYNGDGYNEILMGSRAYANGPIEGVNGTSDFYSYVILLDLQGRLLWQKRLGGQFSICSVLGISYVDQMEPNIFAVVTPSAKAADDPTGLEHQHGRMIALNGHSGEVLSEIDLGTSPSAHQIIEVEPAVVERLGIVTHGADGHVRIYDQDLELKRQSDLLGAKGVFEIVDVNKDKSLEVLVRTGRNRFVVLNEYLQEVAFYQGSDLKGAAFASHSNPNNSRLLLSIGDVWSVRVPDLPPKALAGTVWWINRHSILIAIVVFFLIVILLYLRQRRILSDISVQASELVPDRDAGVIAIDTTDRLVYANRLAQSAFNLGSRWRWKKLTKLLGREDGLKLSRRLSGERTGQVDEDVLPLRVQGHVKFVSVRQLGQHTVLGARLRTYAVKDTEQERTTELVADWYDLSSRIAHEVKKPLTSSLRSVELAESLLEDSGSLDVTKAREELGDSADSLRESLNLIERFLRFRFTRIDFREWNLKDILQEAVDHVLLTSESTANCQIHAESAEITLKTDRERLRAVITLLIQNSMEAIDSQRGQIDLSYRLARDMQRSNGKCEQVVLRIRDNGHGIAQECLPNVFEPFYTTKSKTGGTGLGLAMARKICDVLGAEISLESEERKGTTVTVVLRRN